MSELTTEIKKSGRTPSKVGNKVFTPAMKKLGEASYQITVPYNDENGGRQNRKLILVVVNGNLVVT